MHMERPFLTTTKYNSKGKKPANTAAAREAKAKHEAWLRKQGLLPEQVEMKRMRTKSSSISLPNLKVDNPIPLSNNVAVKGGFRNGIMDNLHKESEAVKQEILDKASRCMPLFNKGGIQYATPATDMTTVGSKSRRG